MTDGQFVDLQIRIFAKNDSGFPVEITLAGQQEFAPGTLAADILSWSASGDLARDGRQLMEMLLADPKLREAWARSRERAPRCRIRLRIDPAAGELHTLPWEVLQENVDLLSAQADTPFSRYLPVALPWGGPIEERPIRLLVVISNPDDLEVACNLPPVNVEIERQSLEQALAVVGVTKLCVDFLDAPATLERLENKLREGYHILHFLGHGEFNPKSGQAKLLMQNTNGHVQRVPDDEFVSMLSRQGIRPRLVFWAACQSATRSSADAFRGLSPKVVSIGVPAVIAMQGSVTIETARKFSKVFYERLLEHGQVDLAINEARSTLRVVDRFDAIAPVLFMRLTSGELWGSEANARGVPSQALEVFWNTLLDRIAEGVCTPIIGPHVHGRWLPTPQEIAKQWSREVDFPFSNKEDLAHVARYISTHGGPNAARAKLLNTLLNMCISRLPEDLRPSQKPKTLTELLKDSVWKRLTADDPNEVHRVLANLNLPLYLTTTCDSFMFEALKAAGRKPGREFCHWYEGLDNLPQIGMEYQDPTPQEPLVYHLFGSDEEQRSLVVSEDHYLDYLTNILLQKNRIPYYIRGGLSPRVLLLVGFSLDDWEFRVLMRGLLTMMDFTSGYNHVAVQLEKVSPAGEPSARDFMSRYFSQSAINVFWGSPAQFVAELRERWEVRQK